MTARGAFPVLAIAAMVTLVPPQLSCRHLNSWAILGDPNYLQQLFLAVCTLALPAAIGRWLPARYTAQAMIVMAGVGVHGQQFSGQQQAQILYQMSLESGKARAGACA